MSREIKNKGWTIRLFRPNSLGKSVLGARTALVVSLCFCLASARQSSPEGTPTLRSSTSLVLVDVIAQDPKSKLPHNEFGRDDFQVFDNDRPVPIVTFDAGSHYDTRPIALWFVVICNEQNQALVRSGPFAGYESAFRSALNDLDKRDSVGVAHWCDNGDAQLDLLPTYNRDAPITALANALLPIPFIAPRGGRIGELAVQAMFRAIIRDAHQTNPQPLPVIVILHGDKTGMPPQELDDLVSDFLQTSGIVFGIKNESVPDMPPLANGERSTIFHYLAGETGGEYFAVPSNLYATALDSIIVQLHFRYQLGFKPPSIDGKRHDIRVELLGEAKKKFKTAHLRYRTEYIPVITIPTWQH